MKANELRIGNYILHKDSILDDFDYLTYVDLIQSNAIGIQCNEDFEMANLSDIEPIELTEEWLKKTDLKKGIEVHNDYFSGIIKVKYNKFVGLFELFIGSIPIGFVFHVHKLQNIVYELSNIELTIK